MERPREIEPEKINVSADFPEKEKLEEAVFRARKVEMAESPEDFIADDKKFSRAIEACSELCDSLFKIKAKKRSPEVELVIDLAGQVFGNGYSIRQFALEIKSGRSGKTPLGQRDIDDRRQAIKECYSNLELALGQIKGIVISVPEYEEKKSGYDSGTVKLLKRKIASLVLITSAFFAGAAVAPEKPGGSGQGDISAQVDEGEPEEKKALPEKTEVPGKLEQSDSDSGPFQKGTEKNAGKTEGSGSAGSPGRAEKSGGESVKGKNKKHGKAESDAVSALKANRPDRPSMAGNGGEPGEFEKEKSIGEVEFKGTSNITEPLWVNRLVRKKSYGYDFCDLKIKGKYVPGELQEAAVTLKNVNIPANTSMCFPVPPGYYIRDIKYSKNIGTGTSSDGGVYFSNGAKDLTITYDVFSNDKACTLEGGRYVPKLARSEDEKKVIDELSKKDASVDKILAGHFKKFTYVVSQDLQEIIDAALDKSKLGQEEATGSMRLGNCSTFSFYASGMINESGRDTAVAEGFLATNKGTNRAIIDRSRPHAKPLYFDANGKPVLFETTAGAKGYYVNVVLSEADKTSLSSMLTGLRFYEVDEQQGVLKRFGDAVRDTLAKPEYEKYKLHGEKSDVAGKDREKAGTGMDLLRSFYSKADELWHSDSADVVILLAIIIGGGALIIRYREAIDKYIERMREKTFEKIRQEKEKTIVATAEYILGGIEQSSIKNNPEDVDASKDKIMPLFDYFYTEYPVLEKIIPIKKVDEMPASERMHYLKALTLNEIFIGESDRIGPLDYVSGMFRNPAWIRQVKRAEADGLDADAFFDSLRATFTDKKRVEKYEKMIPQKVSSAIEQGGKMLQAIDFDVLRKAGKFKPSDILGLLKLENMSSEEYERQKGQSTEFFQHRDYVPGDDLRNLDYKAGARLQDSYGRDKKLVREMEKEKGGSEVLKIKVAVDVMSNSLARLGALLLYMQKNPGKIEIEEMQFIYMGEIMEVLGKDKLKGLTKFGGAVNPEGGLKAISGLFTRIEKSQLENSLQLIKKVKNEYAFSSIQKLEKALPVLKKGERMVIISGADISDSEGLTSDREIVKG